MNAKYTLLCAAALLPLIGGACTATRAQQDRAATGTWAWQHPADPFRSDALLDLRSLNEKEAGQSGFIRRSPDGSFLRGDGKPIRFWAVGSDVYRQAPEAMARHARFLAKMGVNMVRLHTQIAPVGPNAALTGANQKEIDGIWRMVAALKKEGIYATISPYWPTKKDDAGWGIPGIDKDSDLWGLLFFDETLQRGYKAWVKALYSPNNPYTGIPLAQDTAVALIQVQNEDGMFFWTMQGMNPVQKERLGGKFATWLTKKYGSTDAAQKAWGAGAGGDATPTNVKLAEIYELTLPQTGGGRGRRVADQTEFFAETQHQFYADIADYYHRDLGCKQLINASNWITAAPITLNDAERWTYTAADVIAVNKYMDSVHVGDNNGWRIDPGHHFTNESCLLDPRKLPTNLKQVAGYPMVITESSWVSPDLYQAEGPFLMAAYQSLTGVDTFYWFSATQPEYETNPYFDFLNLSGGQHPMGKWTASVPTLIGQFPANALLYRMGYLKQGAPVVHESRPLEDIWQRRTPILAEDRSFDPNRMTGNTGEKSNIAKGVDPLAFLVGPVEVAYGGASQGTHVADLAPFIDHDKKTVRSETGEIRLNYGKGVCVFNAPKAQGVAGFLGAVGGPVALGDITVTSANEYATVEAVSMDDQPLRTSKKVLIQIGTTARPTGWQARPTEFKGDGGQQTFQGYEIVNTGKMPFQIANTDVTLTITNPGLRKATLLDTSGYASRIVTDGLTRSGGKITLRLPADTMYLIVE